MKNNLYGNRITDNALTADDGRQLITRALEHVKQALGWYPISSDALFSGVYYSRKKVGSHIVKVRNDEGKTAVLKLQLRPLPYDEGFIIRHVNEHSHSRRVRTPSIIADSPWSEKYGFGYVIFEDLSDLPDLWSVLPTTESDRQRHGEFLREFMHRTLPVPAWFERPQGPVADVLKETYYHFAEIAEKSPYRHIDSASVASGKTAYFSLLDSQVLDSLHFTHGHLSGKDVKYDSHADTFVLMANLLWSYRLQYYELTFPMWVDIMHIRDAAVTLEDILQRLHSWGDIWRDGLYDHDPTQTKQYWFNLCERATLTIMLDLGASEWSESEMKEKAALLRVWQELLEWIIKNKF